MKRKIFLGLMALALCVSAKTALVNDSAPLFSLKNMAGKEVVLKDFQQKDIVFINFWASWCPPCNQEFPELEKLANDYNQKGLQVLAINIDKNISLVEAFLRKMKIQPNVLQILLDPKSTVVAQYKAQAMPSSFVVDTNGKVRFVHVGYTPNDPKKWRSEIDALLLESQK